MSTDENTDERQRFRAYYGGTLSEAEQAAFTLRLREDAELAERYEAWLATLAGSLLDDDDVGQEDEAFLDTSETSEQGAEEPDDFDAREFQAKVAQRIRRRSSGRLYGYGGVGSTVVTWVAVVGVVVFGVLAMSVWLESRSVQPEDAEQADEGVATPPEQEQGAGQRRSLDEPVPVDAPREEVEAPGQSIDYSSNEGRTSGEPVRQMQRYEFVVEAFAADMEAAEVQTGLRERFGGNRVQERDDGFAVEYRPQDINQVIRRLQEMGLRIDRSRRLVEPEELVSPVIRVRLAP